MRRRTLLRAGATAGVVAVTGCTAGFTDPRFDGGFEDGLGEWETAAHVGPEVPLEEFDWTIDVSDERAATGARILRVRNEGDHDDGTCWASHQVPVEPGQAYTASVADRLGLPRSTVSYRLRRAEAQLVDYYLAETL